MKYGTSVRTVTGVGQRNRRRCSPIGEKHTCGDINNFVEALSSDELLKTRTDACAQWLLAPYA